MSKKFIFFLLIFNFFFFSSSLTSHAAVMDKVLAVVNDELITQSELDRILIPIYRQYRTMYSGDELLLKVDEARRNILNQMIIDKLILCEARKQQIQVKPEEINKKIQELKSKFSSEDEFQQALIGEGVTLVQLQDRFKEELLKEKFIDIMIRRKVVITPTEINEYYNTNIDSFKMPLQVRALNILIKTKEGQDRGEALNRAEEILGRLKTGEDFSQLAKTHSDGVDANNGGDLGYVGKGQLRKELDEVLFSLKAGEISGLVETEVGYHIFMVLDKKEEIILSLEGVYDEIRNVLYKQKAEATFNKLIEGLKKNAYISIK